MRVCGSECESAKSAHTKKIHSGWDVEASCPSGYMEEGEEGGRVTKREDERKTGPDSQQTQEEEEKEVVDNEEQREKV